MKPANREVTTGYGVKGDWWATGEHGGVDYGCPSGDPVYAMWGGTITGASWGSAYGTHLVIDHDHLPNGDPGLWAVYAHLKSKVRTGGRVEAGELIAYSGATGNVSGPHLHVEVQRAANWKQGNYTNPQPWIDASSSDGGDTVWSDYSGKPSGTLTISNAQDYVSMDFKTDAPPSSGLEFHLLYVNCELVWASGADMGIIRVKYRRDDGDDTAYQDYCVPAGEAIGSPDTFLLTATHWEDGEKGKGGRWYLRAEGDLASVKLGTRYAKIAVVS
jgi:hypothetical protein